MNWRTANRCTKHYRRLACTGVFAACLMAQPASAEAIAGQDAPRPHVATTTLKVIDIPAKRLIGLVAAEHGWRVNVSDDIRGSLRKVALRGDLSQMLKTVSAHQPIDWFMHDDMLYVSSMREETVQFLPLKSLSLASAQDIIARSGIDLSRHSIEPVANEAAIKVSGPPMLIELIEAMLALSSDPAKPPKATQSVLLRRGTVKQVEYFGDSARVATAPPVAAAAPTPPKKEEVENDF